jgi:hypothetical protein
MVAAALVMAAAPTPVRASPVTDTPAPGGVTYTLNPEVMAVFPMATTGAVDTITGTFTYDLSNPANNSADLEVSGPVLPGDYYLQSFSPDGTAINATTGVGCPNPDLCLTMTFQQPLSPFTLSQVMSITLSSSTATLTTTQVAGAATPVAVPVPTVSTPATLALLVVGFFLLSRWATRRDRHPDPDRQGVA